MISTQPDPPLDEWHDAYKAAKDQGKLNYALKIALQMEDEKKIRESQEALGIAPPPPEIEPTEIAQEGEEAPAAREAPADE